jgi:1-acyl-sn-glycerol-3-phosphate acyltransferase
VTASGAKPPLSFIPPDPSLPVLTLARLILPYWLTWQENIQQVDGVNVEQLVHLFHDFQAQRVRFMIAFRHPSPQDSFCLGQLLWHQVPRRSRQMGISLTQPVHAHFIYDRGIPLWAGRGVGWLYSKLGGTPIQRGKVDRQGLRSARQLLSQGRWPLAAAPEGGNNGHTEIVSPLEPGVAQLGFWCVEDLQKAQRSESVVVVPLGITYRYAQPPWPSLDRLLDQLEQDNGLETMPPASPASELAVNGAIAHRYQRLYRLGECLLDQIEQYYHRVYGLPLPAPQAPGTMDANPLSERLETLMDAALRVAETYFQLLARGNTIDRCRRIEQAGWDRIFRQDLAGQQALSTVAKGLADREAEEASLRMWHMRLVENFVAVTGQYVRHRPSAERFAETLLILRDTVCLIKGEHPFPRPKLGRQVAQLTVGQPLSISDRWPDYQANRKQAVAQLTADLQQVLEAMIPQETAD